MEYTYSVDRILKNIGVKIKEKKIRIQDFETKIGVSKGYLSRLKENKTGVSVEILMKACNVLGCSLEELVAYPLLRETPNEKLIQDFLNKILSETKEQNLFWKVDGAAWEIEMKTDPAFKPPHPWHPLFLKNVDKNKKPIPGEALYVYKPIVPLPHEKTVTVGDIYCAGVYFMNGGPNNRLYVVQVAPENHTDIVDYELFITSTDSEYAEYNEVLVPVCSSRNSPPIVKTKMKNLGQL